MSERGIIWEVLHPFKCLESLEISCHEFYFPEEVDVTMLNYLECLSLRGCKKVDKLPSEFATLRNLEHLDIRGTGITSLPNEFNRKGLKILKDEGVTFETPKSKNDITDQEIILT